MNAELRLSRSGRHHVADQGGFSLIEVLVAMFILALMSLALIPLLIGGIKASSTNQNLVAATTFAGAVLSDARRTADASGSCAAIGNWAVGVGSDPAGTGLTAAVTLGACPSTYPGTITVAVKVHKPDDESALASLSTKVMVTAS